MSGSNSRKAASLAFLSWVASPAMSEKPARFTHSSLRCAQSRALANANGVRSKRLHVA